MLRITYTETKTLQRWILCGRLAGPWVDELRACWEQGGKGQAATRAMVDLSDVTFIDEAGERLLSEMRGGGAKFMAAGVETRHLLENLKGKGERPLRRFIAPRSGKINGDKNDK